MTVFHLSSESKVSFASGRETYLSISAPEEVYVVIVMVYPTSILLTDASNPY